MTALASASNTHVLYDPPFARAQMSEHFEPWLAIARDMLHYGANLLLRALKSSHDSVPDLIVISSLYRQNLVAADGCLVCLEAGAVQQAMLHARGLIESSWALELVLTEDRNRWARQYYVSSVRQNMSWQRLAIPGSDEAAKAAEAWKEFDGDPGLLNIDAQAVATDLAASQELLKHREYREINGWFEQYGTRGKGKQRRFIEPNWYQPGPGGVSSFRDMAKRISREPEYHTIYKFLSYFTHGSLADNHFKVNGNRATVEPLRYPKQFSQAFNLPFVDLAMSMLRITRQYRPAEEGDYVRTYREEWSPVLMERVKVVSEPVIVEF